MPHTEKFRLEVADRLHSAAIHLLRHARTEDSASQIGPARLSALSVLVYAGPMSLGKLAQVEQVKAPTMSRIVAGLNRSGLARIEADAGDARRIRVVATAKGERLMTHARERRIRRLAQTLGKASDTELVTLLEASELIERALRQSKDQS